MRRVAPLLLLLLAPAARVESNEAQVRLLTDDAIPRYLQRGRELARDKQWAKMVDVLQRVVMGDKDIFPDLKPEMLNSAVYSEDDRIYFPARELCLLEMAKLPPEGLQAYRDAYDKEASDTFEEARRTESLRTRLARLGRVYDYYLVSSVGDDALEMAGDTNLALGRFYEALALYRRLVDVYPKDNDRDMATVLAKAAYCAARIGNAEYRDMWLRRLASEYPRARVTVEGKPVPSAAVGEHPLFRVRAARRESSRDWPVAGGNPARARVAEDLPDSFPRRPFWAFGLRERGPRLTVSAGGRWYVVKHDRQETPKDLPLGSEDNNPIRPYATARPVVHGGLVLYCDYNEVVARFAGSGRFHLFHTRMTDHSGPNTDPTFLTPADQVRPGVGEAGQETTKFETAYRHLEYGGSSMVVTNDVFVTVEAPRPPTYLNSVAAPHIGSRNLLRAYGRKDGTLEWAWEADLHSQKLDPEAVDALMQDHQLHPSPFFRGPGVAHSGILYTIAHWENDQGEVALWAFDLADGRVRYRTPLHYPDTANRRLPVGASLAVAGGVVYIVTNAGVVAAVDALPPGRVRWIRRYDRSFGPDANRPGNPFVRAPGRAGRIRQGFAYNDPVVAEGKVVVAAPDSDELVALDAESGARAWAFRREKIGDPYHIVGVSEGVVVLAGEDSAVGIDLAKGKQLWEQRLAGFAPFGRGLVDSKYAYVPVQYDKRHAALERFELKSGARAKAMEFDVPQLGNLVFVDGRLIAVNAKEILCFTTREAEIARLDARIRDEGDSTEARLARAYVSLAAVPPRRADAHADFLAALALGGNEQQPAAVIATEAIENLLAAAREQRDRARLDEARALLKHLVPDHPFPAQIALLEAEVLGAAGQGAEALAALERFLDEHPDARVRHENRLQKAPFAAGKVRDGLLATSAKFRAAFEASVRDRIAKAYADQDRDALEGLPTRYGRRHPSGEAYFALARLEEESGKSTLADMALRRFIDEFRDDRRRAEAHLRLARLLAKQGNAIAARNEREQGVALLDEQGRQETAELLAELDELMPGTQPVTLKPRVRIPLATRKYPVADHAPVQVEGTLPPGLEGAAVLANETGYVAVGADGAELWRQPNPAGQGAEPGSADEPTTVEAAAAIAATRLARVVDGDLLLGDVTGLMRVNARTGEVRWRYPRNAAQAATEARQSIDVLREDLKVLRESGNAVARRLALPAFAVSGKVVVRVHPRLGVEAFSVATGAVVWQDQDLKAPAVGPPALMGQLVAIGWADPAHVRLYDVNEGKIGKQWSGGAKTALCAPPVLDPLGRLVVMTRTADDRFGRLHVLNARNLEPAFPERADIADPLKAAVLYADGRTVVYHGGNSSEHGDENIHFWNLETNRLESVRGTDLLREYQVLRDGPRLFVFTWRPGDAGVGARLFRLDLQSQDYLRYSWPLPFGPAHARPALTQRYVILAWSGRRSAYVRFYDREATGDSKQPQPVFSSEGKESSELNFENRGATRYRVPPAVAVTGDRAVVSTPFGVFWLEGR